MVKIDWQRGAWSAQFLTIVEARYDRNPPPGSDFIPDVFTDPSLGVVVQPLGWLRRIEHFKMTWLPATPGLRGWKEKSPIWKSNCCNKMP